MHSGAIAYQILQQEKPPSIEKVKAMLEKYPWHANQWQARLQDVPVADRDLVLFIQAARWADDIRPMTSSSTVRRGITSIGCSNPMDNQQACKSAVPTGSTF